MPQYVIIAAGNRHDLERRVERLLKEGWQLAGGLCAATSPSTGLTELYQALTTEQEPETTQKWESGDIAIPGAVVSD